MKRAGIPFWITMVLIASTLPSISNAAALNSSCTEGQWLAGSKVKIGKVTAQCVAGPDHYYWIDTKQVSSDAANAGPLEKKRRSPSLSQTTRPLAIVPDVVGLAASAAMTIIQRAGLSPARIYRSQGGQAGATCAMADAGVVVTQSPHAGVYVKLYSPVQIATSC